MNDDRILITANARTTGVVMTLGDTEVAVRMPSPPGIADQSDALARQAVLRQLRRVLEVARQELDAG